MTERHVFQPITVLVTGDILRETRIFQGDRLTPFSPERLGTALIPDLGNSAFLHRLVAPLSGIMGDLQARLDREIEQEKDPKAVERLRKVKGGLPAIQVQYGLEEKNHAGLPDHLHSMEVWRPFAKGGDGKSKTWRMDKALGYGSKESQTQGNDGKAFLLHSSKEAREGNCDIAVLDDAGLLFRSHLQVSAWPKFLASKADAPRWIVLKTVLPLAGSDLMRAVAEYSGRLILVVDAEDLRHGEVRITRSVSWERTALDLARELRTNPDLAPLLNCRHLFIKLGLEGVLHVEPQGTKPPSCTLYFDPERLEGDFQSGIEGAVFGATSCLVSSLVLMLAQHRAEGAGEKSDFSVDLLKRGIAGGIAAARHLVVTGRGGADWNKRPAIDETGIARGIVSQAALIPPDLAPKMGLPSAGQAVLGAVHIPADAEDDWTILSAYHGDPGAMDLPLHGLAVRVAVQGPSVLADIPKLAFRDLLTVDCPEIESLRNLKSLMEVYRRRPESTAPLSIAVFGTPGSGKSFAVKQITKGVFGEKVPFLEYNLSQLDDASALIGAFHQIRNQAIHGKTPIVFWDEFDTGNHKWLQYFLAPMQDGSFQEGQSTHPIGKCVFVFAGGVSHSFQTFGPRPKDFKKDEDFQAAENRFTQSKGPDFRSRLSAYLNVSGPNPKKTEETRDICYPIRRAILLRRVLGVQDGELLDMDRGLLSALLLVKKYEHGSRSMAKIAEMLKFHGAQGSLLRSDLPPREVVSLHANMKEIEEIAARDNVFRAHASVLAPVIHAFYLELAKKQGWPFKYNMEFEALPDHIKADNIDAAVRIPWLLMLVGMKIVKQGDPGIGREAAVKALQARLEMLAEAEHDGWVESRRRNGWEFGEIRDDERRIHPLMKPYRLLPDHEKAKDRGNVLNLPEIVERAKFGVAREG